MQPIGLLVWIYQAQFKKEQQEFVACKLDKVEWAKYLSISVLLMVSFQAYLSVNWGQSSVSGFHHGCNKWGY